MNRNIEQELIDSIRSIKKGKGRKFTVDIPGDIKSIRGNFDLSQQAFAALLGVSLRTLQDWEQGRRHPTGPALALLKIAEKNPRAFLQQ